MFTIYRNMAYSNDNTRIVENSLILYVRTIIILLVSLYISRVLLNLLGVDDYGIYNIVGSVVVLFSFFNTAMTQAAQRFITFELGTGHKNEIKKVFSMVINTQIFILLSIILLTETIGLWFLNYQLVIPEDRLLSANIAYQLSIITFAINVLKVPFDAIVIAYEKMSFFAYIALFDTVLKLFVIFLLSQCQSDKLISYSVFLFLSTLIVFIVYVYCSFKSIETCRYLKNWDKHLFLKLFSFTGWSLLGSATDVFTQKGFMFILNIFVGVVANAAMGIANQVSGALRTFVNSFQTSFKPQIVKSYANKDYDRFYDLIIETSKLSYSMIILPTLFLIVNMPLLLNVWLGKVPLYAVEFCQIIAVCSVFDALSGPFYCAILSSEKIKKYQIAISIIFLSDLVLTYLLAVNKISPSYILYSRLFTRGLINMMIGLFFLKRKFKFPVNIYIKRVIYPILSGTIIICMGLFLIDNYAVGQNKIFISAVYILFIGILVITTIVLNQRERQFIKSMIYNILKI